MTNTPKAEQAGTFRKKPVVIEAVQYTQAVRDAYLFDRQPLPEGVEIPRKHLHPGNRIVYNADAYIQTLEGRMSVSLDDWIITGVKGERYACKPDIFAATYEPAASGLAAPAPRDEREAFETWVKTSRGSPWPVALDRADAGNYLYLPAVEAWQVWQARAALSAQASIAAPEGDRQLFSAKVLLAYDTCDVSPTDSALSLFETGYEAGCKAASIAAEGATHCPYCDNTGDVHDQTGEWRGVCTECKGAAEGAEPVAVDPDDEHRYSRDQWWFKELDACAKTIEQRRALNGVVSGLIDRYEALFAAAARSPLTDEQWYDLASRHANADWNSRQPDGYLNAIKAVVLDFAAGKTGGAL